MNVVPPSRVQRVLGGAPTFTGVTERGRRFTLRTPSFADADDWRRVRLANQECIEPFWDYSELSWAQRHTRAAWIRECISARRRMRNGIGLHTVIDVDGHLVGQCDTWIDPFHRRSELGGWVDHRHARAGLATAATKLVIAYQFDVLGVDRITAPISPENVATTQLIEGLGFVREGVMRRYMRVGDQRRDHVLWSLVRDDWPALSAAWG